MEKKRLFRIMAKTDGRTVARLAGELKQRHAVVVVKGPDRTLTMIKLREPVKESLFYLGEVMVSEAVVELDGVKGMAVIMGDDAEKVLNMAIIDAACNSGVFEGWSDLLALEREQLELERRENAIHLQTMVSFRSMDTEGQPL